MQPKALPVAYRPMDLAPKNKQIRLLLKDGFGEFPFGPCQWDDHLQRWVVSKTLLPVAGVPIGWDYLPKKEY